jgi:DNA repair protein RecO (recombination protein O)
LITQATLESAFVLHTRPYRDTSLLVDFFTEQQGRITAVARGVRRSKSRLSGLLQPFTRLLITWYGRSELVTLQNAELAGAPTYLLGKYVISGLYLNELLMRLLGRFDPHPQLFTSYAQSLADLNNDGKHEIALRTFELQLLKELGYGLQLDCLAETSQALEPSHYYYFHAGKGLQWYEGNTLSNNKQAFLGEHLLAIQRNDFVMPEVLQTAKRLLRQALASLLPERAIKSRELFLYRSAYEQK